MPKVVEALEDHQPCEGRIDAGNAGLVAPVAGDDAGDEGAVAIVIPGLAIALEEIPADDVVDMPLVVVVDAVVGNLFGLRQSLSESMFL